jgi:hypothetical protein
MDREKRLNSAVAVFLADKVFDMSPAAHWILSLALAAILGRLVWSWVRPKWARYPATVTALAVLALLLAAGRAPV